MKAGHGTVLKSDWCLCWSVVAVTLVVGAMYSRSAHAGLAAKYSFDNSFLDSSAYGFDAQSARPPAFNVSDARFGASADFEADNRQFLEVLQNSMFTSLDDMTVAMWLKPESWSSGSRVFQKGEDYDWRLHAGGNNFKFDHNGRVAYTHTSASTLIPIGQWTHIAAVVDSSADVIKVFANGSEVGSESLAGRGIDQTTQSLFIGAKKDNNDNGDYFDGLMDEFHIYKDALNSAQITELMNTNTVSALPPEEPGPEPNASIEITALFDGRDQLIIKDGTLQWEHFDFSAVGRHEGRNVPTTITTTIDGLTVMDHVEWIPQWSSPPPHNVGRPELSSVFTDLTPLFPEVDQHVILQQIDVRGEASIIQHPSEANDFTLIAEFDDNRRGGSAMYTVRFDYNISDDDRKALHSISAVDVDVQFTPSGGAYGRGQLTAAAQVDVVVEDRNGEQVSYADGSFEMNASLWSDRSDGGAVLGEFRDGTLAFRGSGGGDLIAGNLISLTLHEVGDNGGILAGEGLFEVTGGSLKYAFVESYGEIFQLIFHISPDELDSFSIAFSGSTNVTVAPIPEPATMAMLALGAAVIMKRRRRRRFGG